MITAIVLFDNYRTMFAQLSLLNTVYPVDSAKESFQPIVARLIDSSNYNFSTNLPGMNKQLTTDNK